MDLSLTQKLQSLHQRTGKRKLRRPQDWGKTLKTPWGDFFKEPLKSNECEPDYCKGLFHWSSQTFKHNLKIQFSNTNLSRPLLGFYFPILDTSLNCSWKVITMVNDNLKQEIKNEEYKNIIWHVLILEKVWCTARIDRKQLLNQKAQFLCPDSNHLLE